MNFNTNNIESFTEDRFNIQFFNINLPGENVTRMSSLIYDNIKLKWENLHIYLLDEIKLDISQTIKKQKNQPFSFSLNKLDKTGNTRESFTVYGYILKYNLGKFGCVSEFTMSNEIELEFVITELTTLSDKEFFNSFKQTEII